MALNGIDCIEKYDDLFKNKRIALLTSVTGVDKNIRSTITILHKRYGLTAIFGPEHGVTGTAGAGAAVDDCVDPETGVKVYSLYSANSKRISEEQLKLFDVLVYDIQDVGVRFYTYISTLCYMIEDIAKAGKKLVVLDRIAMLGGNVVEGVKLDMDYSSFVGVHDVPIRYGLTCGEFACMYNKEKDLKCDLTIIKCEGWERNMQLPDTDLLYIPPSMGLPTFESALVYPGTCFFEGTNVSEGRGTTAPFTTIGAPFICGWELANEMNKKELPGVVFRPVSCVPFTSKHENVLCEGVNIMVTDRKIYKSVQTGFELLYEIMTRYSKDFEYLPAFREGGRPFIDLLYGDRFVWKIPPKEILFKRFELDSAEFKERKREFELYK